MKKYAHPDEEALDFEKWKHRLFPNYFKKIGIGITILCLIGLFYTTGMPFQFLKYGVLIGLFLFAYSKEKIEDEMIEKIRNRSFSFAFSMGITQSILTTFIIYFIGNNGDGVFVDLGGHFVLWFFLIFYIFYFELYKRMAAY